MEAIAFSSAAFLAGGVLAFLVASLLLRRAFSERLSAAAERAAAAESRAATTEGWAQEQRLQEARRAEAAAAELARLGEQLAAEREERARVETQAQEAARRLEEERALLADAQTRLTDAFKALAGDALGANQAAFLQLAKETLGKLAAESRGDLGKHQESMRGLIGPLAESLKAYEAHLQSLEKSRVEASARLESQIGGLAGCQEKLQKETASLVTALRTPQVRGRWGELTLRRVVELAGMSEHCDFEEQVSVRDGEGHRVRPDLVVRLPAGKELVVDSKVALEAYLRAVEAPDEATRQALLADHARQTRDHMLKLAAKEYWSPCPQASRKLGESKAGDRHSPMA